MEFKCRRGAKVFLESVYVTEEKDSAFVIYSCLRFSDSNVARVLDAERRGLCASSPRSKKLSPAD